MKGGGWEGLPKINNLFPKVLRFRPLRNKRTKEKDKNGDEKILVRTGDTIHLALEERDAACRALEDARAAARNVLEE